MSKTVKLEQKVQAKGHEIAVVREMFHKKGIFVVNLIARREARPACSKPWPPHQGSRGRHRGRPRHRQRQAPHRTGRIARLADNTVGACHLDAAMVPTP